VSSSTLDRAFGALSDGSRRRILELLRERTTMTAGAIADEFRHVSRPAVSKHLRILREAGLVTAEQHGREWRYALDPSMLAHLQRAWLDAFVPMFDDSLQRLRHNVEGKSGVSQQEVDRRRHLQR
jgi:DNA-binding transcriptional ArsR family regulator